MSPAEKKKKAARQATRKSSSRVSRGDSRRPVIMKVTESAITGVHSLEMSRCCIGYVLGGTKYIYTGDMRSEIPHGDMFFFTKGTHYVENIPEDNRPYEELLFFFTPEKAGRIIADLSISHGVDTSVRHTCDSCGGTNHAHESGGKTLGLFFESVDRNLRGGWYSGNFVAQDLSLAELVYRIVSRPEGCIRTRVLGSTDPEKELLELQINEYIFSDISLDELAIRNNRSLSSFKKKFKDYFNESPHRWVVRQRLMHARLSLISTNKTITQIGQECRFPNISHFIKLFSAEFGMTPASYRRKYHSEMVREGKTLSIQSAPVDD